jgi:hypothetical protein
MIKIKLSKTKGTMSRKKRKVVVDDDWMSQLDTMASNSKKPGGNRHLFKLTSFPAELLRDGTLIKWRPFSFKIHEVADKELRSMTIIEDGVEGAKPVEVRLGTQPMNLIQSKNLGDVVLYCKEYSVTKFQDRPQIFLWFMQTDEMIIDAITERRRWARQLTLPVVKIKRKKKKLKKI